MNLDRIISIIIVIALIIGTIGVFYIMSNPNPEKFTEFYLLGQNGKASDYPTNLSMGETGNLTVGVVNHENSTSNYQIIIMQGNQVLKNENITLNNGDKQEIPFQFTASYYGQNKLEFDLYKLPDTKNIYRSLSLIINVT